MFTGIVSAVGRIVESRPLGGRAHGRRLVVEAPDGWLADVGIGDSIALNGACMTATAIDAPRFGVDVSAESLARTARLAEHGRVNLEKALRAGDRLGGHLVSGHVDGTGEVTHVGPVGESRELRIRAPRELAAFLAYKGSVAVDGVSLTVNSVADTEAGTDISINLIPHTLAGTTLDELRAGMQVNLEIDLIARYVARILAVSARP